MFTLYLVQPEDHERDEWGTLNKRKSTKDWVNKLTTTPDHASQKHTGPDWGSFLEKPGNYRAR